ncbi:MAG TPA: carboxypeptidase regulatory-like domain-containing protein [Terriglobales bacterium]|nr:carboxypeptidase regulatory-like domain-containing protein [Terriglobales bacterium]
MKSRLRWFVLLVFSLCSSAALFAQDTASITGTVTDPSGAAVPGAQVSLISAERGINRTTATNGSGDYLFASLPIGSYDLTVSDAGFKKYDAKGIILRVAEKARVNVQLEVGAINTEVIVQGQEVAQVETQSSDLGGTVTGKEITQLELNGRNFTQLITLVPGVSNQTGQDEAGVGVSGNVSFSVNGGRTEYNNWEMDGGDAMDNGSNSTLNVYPSIDAIAEFKVLTSNYGAQYGRNGSGTVEVETKSGTSSFHGDLYEFVRNDFFNATPEFQTSPPAYKKNDFGFTIGGPVYIPGHYNKDKQKTFFFWSEEWRREIVPGSGFFSVTTVPSLAERGGNFSDVCPVAGTTYSATTAAAFPNCPAQGLSTSAPSYFPNNQVPISNPTVVNALEGLIPTPNIDSNSWYLPPSLPTHWREELFRIDHNVNDKVRATFRYIHDSWNQDYPVPLWTNGTTFPTIQTNFNGPGVSMVARVTAAASPTLLNEFVASYTTDHITTSLIGPWQRPAGFPSIGIYDNGFGGKVPGIMLSGGQYNFAEDPGYVPNGPLNSNPTFTFRDNLTKNVGPHNLQLGIYVVLAHKNEIPQPQYGVNGQLQFSNTGNTVTTGNPFADLLLGNIGTFTQEQAALKMHEQYQIFEPYFQDDWHATPRLTLNLGLRMSFFGTYSEKDNLAWNFDPARYVPGASGVDPNTGLVIGNPYNGWVDCGVTPGVPKGCMASHWWNPAPRIGFAFDPLGNGKWAVRGGYGIFFEHTNGNEANTESLEPFNINTQTSSVVNVAGYANLTPALLGAGTTPLSFVSIPSKATWPYMQQWHLDVQHDMGKNTVATLAYVGSGGVHLTRAYEYNQMHAVPAALNPYAPGQPISQNDCNSVTLDPVTAQATATVNGITTTGSWANNLAVACGNNANPYLPFVGIGSIIRKDQTGSSNYNALQASLRHSIGGLQLNAAYTYSHSIDDSSDWNDSGFVDSYNLNAYRASSNFDERHIINIGYVYDLPFLKGKSLTDKLLGGWQWSGITDIESGTPFSVYNQGCSPCGSSVNGSPTSVPTDNAGVSNSFASAGSYPDLVGNPTAGIPVLPPGNPPLLYNPAAFAAPTGLTFGNAGRNILHNPWRTNFDMALLKHFAVTESKYFEFRAEAFNVFNHREYAWLGGDAGSAADNANGSGITSANAVGCYGGANSSAGDPSCLGNGLLQPNAAHNPRILQLALKFFF